MPGPAAQRGGTGGLWASLGLRARACCGLLALEQWSCPRLRCGSCLGGCSWRGLRPRVRSPHTPRSLSAGTPLRSLGAPWHSQALPAARYQGDFATHQTRKPGLCQGEPLIFLLSFSLQGVDYLRPSRATVFAATP